MNSNSALFESIPAIFGKIGRMERPPAATPIRDVSVISTRFDSLWAAYPEPYKSVIDQSRLRKPISLVFEDDQIPASVKIAGHLDGVFYFRWKRIPLEQLDVVIVHEIAHYFIDARDNRDWTAYQTILHKNQPDELKRVNAMFQRVEEEAVSIERDVRRSVGLAVRRAEQQLCEVILAAKQSVLVTTSAETGISGLIPAISAAAQQGAAVNLVIELGESPESKATFESRLRELPSTVVVSLWPSANEKGPGKLFFECAAADRQRAFIALADPTLDVVAREMRSGVFIQGDDAASFQRHFDELVQTREFERLELPAV